MRRPLNILNEGRLRVERAPEKTEEIPTAVQSNLLITNLYITVSLVITNRLWRPQLKSLVITISLVITTGLVLT